MEKQETLDIISLVKDHPLTRLSNDDHGPLVNKIKEKFTSSEQQLFVANFYTYLNYNTRKDFVIELDKIYRWIGFSRKSDCKSLLINNFIENEDYKIEKAAAANAEAGLNLSEEGKNLGGSGLNKEIILLTIRCFKKLCLKAKTKKSDEIHEYYIQLEEIMNELVYEQSEKLRNQLTIKDSQKEQNLLINFHKKPILYIGYAEENLIKGGYSNNIKERLTEHKHDIKSDFTFEYVYESLYNREIERRLFKHPKIIKRRIKKICGLKLQTELIQLDSTFTINELNNVILEIKKQVESGENDIFEKEILELEKENSDLKLKIEKLEKLDSSKFPELKEENRILKLQIEKLKNENLKNTEIITETSAKIIDLQTNSMQDLDIKIYEIKKAVCYNFLVDFITKEIVLNDNKIDFEIKLSVHEIFETYKKFRISNHYTDPIYDETYENSIITKAFNEVDGIKCTYKTINGVQSRAKIFYVSKIVGWLCENINIPKRFRNMFKEISKKVVFTEKHTKILNPEIDENTKLVYSFLISILLNKYKEDITIIKDTIITEEYIKFMLSYDTKKLSMTKVYEILLEVSGITRKQRIKELDKKFVKGLQFETKEVNEWINDNLELE